MSDNTAGGGRQEQTALRQASRQLYRIGPFKAKLTPTPVNEAEEVPERLNASLLTRAANMHGFGYLECARAAACRRPVRLVRTGSRKMVIPHAFSFHLPGSALIEQLALFDEQGRLRFFGPLISPRQGFERPEEFRFEGSAVEVNLG